MLTDAVEALENLQLKERKENQQESSTSKAKEVIAETLLEEEEPFNIGNTGDNTTDNDDDDDAFANAFTDEELYSVLHSLIPEGENLADFSGDGGNIFDHPSIDDDHDSSNNDSPILGLLQQPLEELPDLDVPRLGKTSIDDSDDDDDDSNGERFLQVPLQDLDTLFDDDDDDQDEISNSLAATAAEQQLEDEAENFGDNDAAALELLEQLGNLTLDFQSKEVLQEEENEKSFNNNNESLLDSSVPTMPHPTETIPDDGLPTYLYCQPCNPSPGDGEAMCLCCPPGSGVCVNQWNLPPMDDDYINAYLSSTQGELAPTAFVAGQQQQQQHSSEENADHSREQRRPVVHRPAAVEAARPLAKAFGVSVKEKTPESTQEDTTEKKPLATPKAPTTADSTERACLGHKERILGLDLSECGNYLATASQDSTVRIWDVATNRLLATLTDHSQQHECLRVAWASSTWGEEIMDRTPGLTLSLSDKGTKAQEDKAPFGFLLATGGADGWVHLYGCPDPSSSAEWYLYASLDHSKLNHFAPSDDQEDKPQIYSLQFIDNWTALPGVDSDASNSFLLTSSDDHVHLWEIDAQKKAKAENTSADKKMHLREVMSIRFGDMHGTGYGVFVGQVSGQVDGLPSTVSDHEGGGGGGVVDDDNDTSYRFGGSRNPQNLVYVFDASYCQANDLLGVALSDGTLRILNGRGVCLSLLQLPGVNAHLTSFAWDATGTRLATCVATGHIVTWGIEKAPPDDPMGSTIYASCSAIFEGGHDLGRPLFGTRYWGNRSKDDNAEELLLSWGVDGRLCVWDSRADEEIDEPIAVLVEKPDYPIYAVEVRPSGVIALGGGGSEGGFVGIPAYVYDVPDPTDAQVEGAPSKKSKS